MKLRLKLNQFRNRLNARRKNSGGKPKHRSAQVKKVKQRMMVVFQEHGMRVTAVANTKVANFLDVTFNKVHRP